LADGFLTLADWNTFNNKAGATNTWLTTGNTGLNSGNNFIGNTDLRSIRFRTNNVERVVFDSLGRIGIGVTDPTARAVIKDSLEIRRIGTLSQLLFTNTSGFGDFRIAGDGGDLYWQGGGGRVLQMGSFHPTVLGGDRQTTAFPAFANGSTIANIGVLIPAQRDASVALAVQANSGTQTANLTDWRNSSGTVLSSINRNGFLGLGTSNPSTLLHIAGTNPLTLIGVAQGTSTTADSLLTVTSGLVRKLPMSTFVSSANTWSTTGNAGTTLGTHFVGTTDLRSLRFRTNNVQGFLLDSAGNVAIGKLPLQTAGVNMEKFLVDAGSTAANPATSINVINARGFLNSYLQLNIQNKSDGNLASSDLVATADNGDETTNYVDLGINSSGNASGYFGGPNDSYLYNVGQNFLIGAGTAGKSLVFMTGGGTQADNERMRINGTGNVGIGTTTPTQKLDVTGTVNATTGFLTNGSLRVDANETNVGTGAPGLLFGNSSTGESISSNRQGALPFKWGIDFWTNYLQRMTIANSGNIGVGVSTPSSLLHLGSGTNNNPPLKLTSGTNLTTPQAGSVEFDGTNYFATTGTTRFTLAKTLTNTASLDFPSTAANTFSILTVTVTGAVDGDPVTVGPPSASIIGNSSYTAFVSSANTVTIRLINHSAASIDPSAGTFRVAVLKY
jgi:hypothetical protein